MIRSGGAYLLKPLPHLLSSQRYSERVEFGVKVAWVRSILSGRDISYAGKIRFGSILTSKHLLSSGRDVSYAGKIGPGRILTDENFSEQSLET